MPRRPLDGSRRRYRHRSGRHPARRSSRTDHENEVSESTLLPETKTRPGNKIIRVAHSLPTAQPVGASPATVRLDRSMAAAIPEARRDRARRWGRRQAMSASDPGEPRSTHREENAGRRSLHLGITAGAPSISKCLALDRRLRASCKQLRPPDALFVRRCDRPAARVYAALRKTWPKKSPARAAAHRIAISCCTATRNSTVVFCVQLQRRNPRER